jgi:hypothetical protein
METISALSLKMMAPEIGMPDLAERRVYTRLFPKDAAERACYLYLLALMRASPDYQQPTKKQLEHYCRGQFSVPVESFEDCWRTAIEASGACWNKPGRRRPR